MKKALEKSSGSARFRKAISPYAAKADDRLVAMLKEACMSLKLGHKVGTTITASGFFANQGRDVSRVRLSVPDVDQVLAALPLTPKAENFEMEASFLLHFMTALGHRAGALCLAIANRKEETFMPNYSKEMKKAARAVIHTLASMRKSR
jgi:uridine phosphorylase